MGEQSSSKKSFFSRMPKMDQYFLEEKCPFSGKRKTKNRNIQVAAFSLIALTVVFLLFAGGSETESSKPEVEPIKSEDVSSSSPTNNTKPSDGAVAVGGGWGSNTNGVLSLSAGSYSQPTNPRQYGASQIVRGGDGGGTGVGIPMGSTVSVRLINSLVSSDSAQPVIAELVEDAIWRNSVLVPTGTKAIGTASMDEASKRLQIRFHTFVYPEGDQHAVSAIALLQNGSSGIPGDYHSGSAQKQLGSFLGNFVGGLADGMKERQTGGQAGIPYEPGSIKNGILNGISVSALDQAKAISEDVQNVHPYLEVAGGTPFLLYFEKEYSP